MDTGSNYLVKACANFGNEIKIYYYTGDQTMKCVTVDADAVTMPSASGSVSRVFFDADGKFVKLETQTSKLANFPCEPSTLMVILQYIIQLFNLLNPFQSISAYHQGGMYLMLNDQYYLQGQGSTPNTWSGIELTSNRMVEIRIDGKGFYINHWVAYVYILLFELASQSGRPHFGRLRARPFGELEFPHAVQLMTQYCNGLVSRNLSDVDFGLMAKCVSDLNDSESQVNLIKMVITILQKDALTTDKRGKAKGVLVQLCKELDLNGSSPRLDFMSLLRDVE